MCVFAKINISQFACLRHFWLCDCVRVAAQSQMTRADSAVQKFVRHNLQLLPIFRWGALSRSTLNISLAGFDDAGYIDYFPRFT